ncbi:MAG: tetratricopeptide repeat protein [Myxococcota bacterium]|jgi:tetratricopeptide (TPR) repeat protein|nr:tetratricopeptide repeat protein [Myxococcota bacterium]
MRCSHCHFENPPGLRTCECCNDSLDEALADLPGDGAGESSPRPLLSLAGRKAELAELERCLAQVVEHGTPQSLLLLGPTGIGKRRLVTEFIRRVRQADEVLVCRGYSSDASPPAPYPLFQRLTRNRYHFREDTPIPPQLAAITEEVTTTYGGEAAEILRMLAKIGGLPELAGPRATTPEEVDGHGFSFAAYRYYLEAEARRRPLLLTLEGFQETGDESLELLQYLSSSLEEGPILLLATATPALLDRLELSKLQATGVQILELPPLSESSSASLLEQLLEGVEGVPADLAALAHARTSGLPALLLEFVRGLISSGAVRNQGAAWVFDRDAFSPDRVVSSRQLLDQAQIEQLTADDRTLLARAAVIGATFWVEGLALLARATNRREGSRYLWRRTPWLERVRSRLESLQERGVVAPAEDARLPGEEAYAFVREEDQQRLLRLLGPEEIRRYHHLLAQWLEQTRPAKLTAGRLLLEAHHLEEAGDGEAAARAFQQAARAARAELDRQSAEELLDRAQTLARPDDALFLMDVLHDRGDLAELTGELGQAMGYFTGMLEWAWLLDHRRKGGAAYDRIGRLHRKRGSFDRAMDCFMTAWGLFEAAGDFAGVAACMDDVGQVHWLRGHQEEALDHYQRALVLRQERADQRGVALSLHNIGVVLAARGDFAEALDRLTEALELRKAGALLDDVISSLITIGELFHELGEQTRAAGLWEEALTLVRETGDRHREAQLQIHLGGLALEQDNPLQAKALAEQALAQGRRFGDPLLIAEGERNLALAEARLDRLAEARPLATRALSHARELGTPRLLAAALGTLAELERFAGHPEEARPLLEQAVGLLREQGHRVQLGRGLDALVALLDELGSPGEAQEIREELERLRAGLGGSPGPAAPAPATSEEG